MVVVDVISRRRRPGVRAASVRADARRLLRDLGVHSELSIALVGDSEMQHLNAHYRGKDSPTDVLSFGNDLPLRGNSGRAAALRRRSGQARPSKPLGDETLGDVVISVDTAARQAAVRGVAVADEVRLLLTHGVLHLLGYDHERSAADARRMFALQRRLVAMLERCAQTPSRGATARGGGRKAAR